MASPATITSIEAELEGVRSALRAKSAKQEELKSGLVKSLRFYHNSKTRHHAMVFVLDNGDTVHKDLRDNALEVLSSFRAAKQVAVWYDETKSVQQYVASFDY